MSEQPLTCHEVIELLSNYIEGALSADEHRRVDEHLAICDGCTTYLEQMRETIRLSGMVTEEQVPEDDKASLLAAFRDWRT
ncbi:MAG TPA: zf-HC2 domain-containing protein [Actinomycetota bacterium]|jgi:predicted anti-sigma-YlaC factor YlaD|nr:zf-HC2 domain-containing protein [Actinomycetota bacterium]